MEITFIYFVFIGLIGGVAHVIMEAKSWSDLKNFSAFKKSTLGAICGFIYYFLYSDYDFPNALMTFISGWWGTTFIMSIIEKYKGKNK